MELKEILEQANKMMADAQNAYNQCDHKLAGDKLLEVKNFLVDNCDDTPEEPGPEASADEGAETVAPADKEASQEEPTEVPSES